jgi:Fe-S cluster biogenesis protein NfuA
MMTPLIERTGPAVQGAGLPPGATGNGRDGKRFAPRKRRPRLDFPAFATNYPLSRSRLPDRRFGGSEVFPMFIQTEATPNPATLKFLPGRTVLEKGTMEFRKAEEAAVSPLAARLFDIEGVSGVFFGSDFISVTKHDAEWQHLKPAILGAIMEHYLSGAATAKDGDEPASASDESCQPGDEEIVSTIKELLETRVRPAVAQDGGDITFHSFRDGVVFLHMRGACSGCPSSTATLQHGIENLLRHFVPEVQEVRPV